MTLTSKQGRVGYLGARHLVGGQGDDAFYPGVADVLKPVGRDELDGLKDDHAMTHYQLQQRNTAQRRRRDQAPTEMSLADTKFRFDLKTLSDTVFNIDFLQFIAKDV